MIPYENTTNEKVILVKKNGGLTPEKLMGVLEGSEYVSVDLNEDESKVVVELDETKLDTEVTEDSDNLITSGAVFEAIAAIDAPVTSVNSKTGAVELNAGDIYATNAQTIQDNLERIDEAVEGVIDDLEGKLDASKSAVATVGGLVIPTASRTEDVLVGVSTDNDQMNITIGDGLSVSNDVLSYEGTVLYATFDSSTGTLNLSTTA